MDETSLQPIEPAPAENTDSRYGDKYVAATLKDRAAAFVIDVCLLALVGLVAANIMTYLTRPVWNGIPNLSRFHIRLLLGALGLTGFLYFFILEGAIGVTLGKRLCHLKITTKRGEFPSLMAIALRNILRPVELALAPVLTLPIMEWTHFGQRPSDLLLGTIVVRRLDESAEEADSDLRYVSATGRLISAFIGAIFLAALFFAALLNVSSEGGRWMTSVILLNTLPVALILYKLILNAVCESDSVGWFFGHRLVSETGGRITFAGTVIRALLFPLDLLAAYPAMLLSPRRQRLGDFLGGTAVVRGRTSWYRGIAPLVITLLLTAGLTTLGLNQRGNFLQTPLSVNFWNQWIATFPDAEWVSRLTGLIRHF